MNNNKPEKNNFQFEDDPRIQPSGEPDSETKIYVLEQLTGFKDSIISNFIAIFGLFTALITFLGFGVGIFSNLNDIYGATGLILILLAGVLTLVLASHLFQKNVNKLSLITMIVLITIFMISGLFLLTNSKQFVENSDNAEAVKESNNEN